VCDALGITALATESIGALPPLVSALDLDEISHAWEMLQIDGLVVTAEQDPIDELAVGLRDAETILGFAADFTTFLRRLYGSRDAAGFREVPPPDIGTVAFVGLALVAVRRTLAAFDALVRDIECEGPRFRARNALLAAIPEATPYVRAGQLAPPDVIAKIEAFYLLNPGYEADIKAIE
jgi:hypothetical protein